eukprot:scaffold4350_cov131-Skeletonema_menzelii.AAC.2
MTSTKKKQSKSAFSKHTEQQLQQQQSNDETNNNNAAAANNSSSGDFGQMSLKARVTIFILVPFCTGFIGLFSSFLQSTRPPATNDNDTTKAAEPHTIDFDRDFVTPFLLGLALVIVIGFQTGGFRYAGGMTPMERKFALSWPKARRVKKVRRERVIVEDEDVDSKKER